MNIIPGVYAFNGLSKYYLLEVDLTTGNAKLAWWPSGQVADIGYKVRYMLAPANNWQPA